LMLEAKEGWELIIN